MGKRVADMTITEYRINKKGCECFRSREWKYIQKKMAELKSAKPGGKFTIQRRSARKEKNGFLERDYMGRINWTPWLDI